MSSVWGCSKYDKRSLNPAIKGKWNKFSLIFEINPKHSYRYKYFDYIFALNAINLLEFINHICMGVNIKSTQRNRPAASKMTNI